VRIEVSADYHGIASRGPCSGPGNEVIAHRAYYRFVLRSLQVWEGEIPDGRGGQVSQKRGSRDQSVQQYANHPVLLFKSSFFDCVSALASRRSSSLKRWHARLSELIIHALAKTPAGTE